MKPKFTDQGRYPRGYTPAQSTDIRKTFERIRREQAEEAKRDAEIKREQEQKLTTLRRAAR